MDNQLWICVHIVYIIHPRIAIPVFNGLVGTEHNLNSLGHFVFMFKIQERNRVINFISITTEKRISEIKFPTCFEGLQPGYEKEKKILIWAEIR